MKIFIVAKPRAKKEYVKKINDTHFVVSVRESPIKGRANKAIIKALASFLGIASLRLNIVSGQTGKQKIIEIL